MMCVSSNTMMRVKSLDELATESIDLGRLKLDPMPFGSPLSLLMERAPPRIEGLATCTSTDKMVQIRVGGRQVARPFRPKSSMLRQAVLEASDARKEDAARLIHSFFVQSHRILRRMREKELALQQRLRSIQETKNRELCLVADWKQKQLQEASREFQNDRLQRSEHKGRVFGEHLQDANNVIGELTRDLMVFKKENAFLSKRCSELRRGNETLRKERQATKEQLQLTKRDSLKLPKMIQKWKSVLTRHKLEVKVLRAQLQDATEQLKSCRLGNQNILAIVRKIVQLVEARDPGQWDLVDELYKIQRDAQQQHSHCNKRADCGRKTTYSKLSNTTSSSKESRWDFHKVSPTLRPPKRKYSQQSRRPKHRHSTNKNC
jgi:chromosome segregation ATPase